MDKKSYEKGYQEGSDKGFWDGFIVGVVGSFGITIGTLAVIVKYLFL